MIAFKEWKCEVHLKSLKIGENTSKDVVHTKEDRFTVNAITMFIMMGVP